MKVLHIIPSVAPCRGGPSEAVLAMVRSLNRHGTTAHIVTTNDNGASVLSVPTGQFMDHEGAQVCFLPRWSPGMAALREFQYAADFSTWLEQQMLHYDALHIHAVFSYLSTRAMLLARRSGKPYLVRPLGQLDPWSLQQSALKKRCYLTLIERANLKGAAAIHCTSESEAEHVKALLPEARVEVIPHGIDARPGVPDARERICRDLSLPASTPVLLFLSRWHQKKNIPLLLEALQTMQCLPWTLVLAGSTDDRELATSVHEQIAALGLKERVTCPGHVSGEAKNTLLQGADVFVLPSASENFGIAVAEAMVSGLPVLVTSGVDLATTVQTLHAGHVCEPEVDAIAAGLRAMLQAPASYDQREHLRRAATAHFSWAHNAQALNRLYSSLCLNPQ